MAILACVCTVPANAKGDPEEIVATVWNAVDCPYGHGLDIKRGSNSRNSQTGCYKLTAGRHAIRFHDTGQAFHDFDCNDAAGGEPPLEQCYGSGKSEIRGFKIYEHPAE